jgi:hypothetical protein
MIRNEGEASLTCDGAVGCEHACGCGGRSGGRAKLGPMAHAAGYTVDDWLKLPDSGERIELIDLIRSAGEA